jgi:hypothetical protein
VKNPVQLRPPVPHAPEPGKRWAAVEEDRRFWRLADPGKKCRWNGALRNRACGGPAAVKLLRGTARRVWWHYCLLHSYGRWTENGKVMSWRQAEDPDGQPPQA